MIEEKDVLKAALNFMLSICDNTDDFIDMVIKLMQSDILKEEKIELIETPICFN